MTLREQRIEICRRLGAKEDDYDTPLTKPTLNSLHAYLTGSFEIPPRFVYSRGSPNRETVMEAIAVAVTRSVDVEDPMDSWFARHDHGETRPWRPHELDAILDAMESVGDRRHWSGGLDELADRRTDGSG